MKMTDKDSKSDVKNFCGLEEILNKPVKQAFILSDDVETKYFGDKIIALNAAMFLG